VTLDRPADAKVAGEVFFKTVVENSRWLSANAINNKMPGADEMRTMLTRAGLAAHQAPLNQQRFHAARMDLATLIYAYAMEKAIRKSRTACVMQPQRSVGWRAS
jgi:hypothetical protein